MSDKHPLIDAEAARLFSTDEAVEHAKKAAFRLLAVRARSKSEIISRLDRKNFSRDVVKETVETLECLGMLDDRAFSIQWVESRQGTRPMGRIRLERELSGKGIAPEVISQVLDDLLGDRDPQQDAIEVLRKRAKRYRGLDREKALRRMGDLLRRRGFSPEESRKGALLMWSEMGGES